MLLYRALSLYNQCSMIKLTSLKKRSLYLIGSFFALVASYIIANNTESPQAKVVNDTWIPEVFADVPSGDAAASGGDDTGDSN